jgi:hypothetical protein
MGFNSSSDYLPVPQTVWTAVCCAIAVIHAEPKNNLDAFYGRGETTFVHMQKERPEGYGHYCNNVHN